MNGIKSKFAEPVLSICIPTWNRAKYLDKSLNSIFSQIGEISEGNLELFVSDNASDDNTSDVINKYIELGLPITYNRNTENIGAARNFLNCINWASGKYILLLGDDDILKPRAINMILDALRGDDYGMLHIRKYNNLKKGVLEYNNTEEYLKSISFWITFMSGSVFRKDIVSKIDSDKYINTHLLQVPYFVTSAFSKRNNLLINDTLLEEGLDSSENGGYNFYEVFVKNYLDIWKDFVDKGQFSNKGYEYIKKDLFFNFVINFNYKLLIKHENVMSEDKSYIGNRKGFKIEGATKILTDYYGNYYYKLFARIYYNYFRLKDMIKHFRHR